MNVPWETDVKMDLIDFGDRLRDVDQAAAEMLAVSIKERGLLNRIKLRKREDGTFKEMCIRDSGGSGRSWRR